MYSLSGIRVMVQFSGGAGGRSCVRSCYWMWGTHTCEEDCRVSFFCDPEALALMVLSFFLDSSTLSDPHFKLG